MIFKTDSAVDADLFAISCSAAAEHSQPAFVGCIEYNPEGVFDKWLAEGEARASINKAMRTAAGKKPASPQRVPGNEYTVDQLGRICEGPIELLLGLDVAAVVQDGTDARPDKTLDSGLRFDVKGSRVRPENSFAIPCWQAMTGKYDALLLVQHVRPGLVRVWACKCKPGDGWQQRPPARAGNKPFFRIACPEPEPAEA